MSMRTTIFVDDHLGRAFQQAAKKKGLSLSAFMVQAGRLLLAQKDPRPRPFELITFGQGGLLPGVQIDKIRQTLDAEDQTRFPHRP